MQDSIANNSHVAFYQSFDGTYSGNMSGSGSLYSGGTGNVELRTWDATGRSSAVVSATNLPAAGSFAATTMPS
jgi:hypothetical protein